MERLVKKKKLKQIIAFQQALLYSFLLDLHTTIKLYFGFISQNTLNLIFKAFTFFLLISFTLFFPHNFNNWFVPPQLSFLALYKHTCFGAGFFLHLLAVYFLLLVQLEYLCTEKK